MSWSVPRIKGKKRGTRSALQEKKKERGNRNPRQQRTSTSGELLDRGGPKKGRGRRPDRRQRSSWEKRTNKASSREKMERRGEKGGITKPKDFKKKMKRNGCAFI